jgi:hypothetical protein
MYEHHTNAFFNECRAFGRLKEVDREELAVKAHGYVTLDLHGRFKEQLIKLAKSSPYPTSSAQTVDYPSKSILSSIFMCPPGREKELRFCILKDYVKATTHSMTSIDDCREDKAALFPKMLEDLHGLHECGIVVYDIHRGQYVNGVLVDFGRAATIPHIDSPEAGLQPRWLCASQAANDLQTFQSRIIDRHNQSLALLRPSNAEARRSTLQAYRNSFVYDPERLPSFPYEKRPLLPLVNGGFPNRYKREMTQFPRYDPAEFDWKMSQAAYSQKRGLLQEGGDVIDFQYDPRNLGEASAPRNRKLRAVSKASLLSRKDRVKTKTRRVAGGDRHKDHTPGYTEGAVTSKRKRKKQLCFSLTKEQLEREASGEGRRWALEVMPARAQPRRRTTRQVTPTAASSRPRRSNAKY